MSSDSSDIDATPKKKIVLKFTEGDLPNCEEIKQFVKSNPKYDTHDFSSDSETENNSQEEQFLFSKRKIRKINAKTDLTKQFAALPTRVLTRLRKPVLKEFTTIMKPKYLLEQEAGIDEDIITENISRIKTFLEKTKGHKEELKNRSKKSSLNIENKTEKKDVRSETSKTAKSKLDEKSSLGISKVVTRNELKKRDVIVKNKRTNKSISHKKKYNNGTKKNNVHKSPKNDKIERKLRIKTSSRLQKERQEHDPSTASIVSTVKLYQSRSKARRNNKEKVDSSIASPEPRRSRRTKATKDVESDPTPPKPKSILKPSVCDQSAVYNKSTVSMTESPKRLKKSAELKVLSPTRFRSLIIQNSGLRPLKSRTGRF